MVTIQAGVDASIAFQYPADATDPQAFIPRPAGDVALPVAIVGATVVTSLPATLTDDWPAGTGDIVVTARVRDGRITIGTEPLTVSHDVQIRRNLRATAAAAYQANVAYLETANPDSQVTALTRQINALIKIILD